MLKQVTLSEGGEGGFMADSWMGGFKESVGLRVGLRNGWT